MTTVEKQQTTMTTTTKTKTIASAGTTAFANRFGFVPNITADPYITYLGLNDTVYSGTVNGVNYSWSPVYGWYDLDD